MELDGDRPIKIIKPLNLAQTKAHQIIDHGGTWRFRLKNLQRRSRLPDRVMFTIARPERTDEYRHRACVETAELLKKMGVVVIDYERKQVLDFARMQ